MSPARIAVTTFWNHYDCPCGERWGDRWCATCDDDCPACGTTCSPTDSGEEETTTLRLGADVCEVCGSPHEL